jgi:hypothetical protein
MSTLNVSNITDGTTTVGTSYVVNGSAKVWMNMTGTGTIAINDSLNVSSASDLGTGNYQIFYTSSMANVNYSVGTSGAASSAGSANDGKNIANVELLYISTLGSYADCADASVVYFGDLA